MIQTTPVPKTTITNGDEWLEFGDAKYIGNFHKTLPRHSNGTGEVNTGSYKAFAEICDLGGDFESVPASKGATKLINPQAGRASEILGPNPINIHMIPAPSVLSESTAAEMVELYWMANLRDVEFNKFQANNDVGSAINDISISYQKSLDSKNRNSYDIRLGLDLPMNASGALDISPKTLFRCGLKDEEHGPLVSQFLLHDINYGAQLIQQTQVPYVTGGNYLENFSDWFTAQETGKDSDGNAYGDCNNYSNQRNYYGAARRHIATMRDLARFVNRDALHQAYFNAALLLNNWGAPLDSGNPYNMSGYNRQVGFGTLGGPNLLALVSEVASRALKVVWRQKWLHRRLRPEAYGGHLHLQVIGEKIKGKTINPDYGLPNAFFNPLKRKSYLLPLAFTAGSPAHPAYGAGHATVAGACVTILKAWFHEDEKIKDVMTAAAKNPKDPSPYFPKNPTLEILKPGKLTPAPLQPYTNPDAKVMTVGGELNKLASNVAMGRSMGGVHWRSDNTRSLRLGEQVATIMLSRILPTYAERPSLSYTNFDKNIVTIHSDGKVAVPDDLELQQFYTRNF